MLSKLGKADESDDQTANTVLNSVQSASWNQDLNSLLSDFIVRIYIDSMEEAVGQIGVSFGSDNPFMEYANAYSEERTAELVKGLEDSTKDMLRSDLIECMNQGLTPAEIAKELQDNYAFSEQRASTIARTETGFTWNHAGITTYQEGGAKAVRVYDGDSDKECEQADGETWTFEYALEHRLEHPNCVRSFGPQMEDITPDRDVGYEPPVETGGENRRGKRKK